MEILLFEYVQLDFHNLEFEWKCNCQDFTYVQLEKQILIELLASPMKA